MEQQNLYIQQQLDTTQERLNAMIRERGRTQHVLEGIAQQKTEYEKQQEEYATIISGLEDKVAHLLYISECKCLCAIDHVTAKYIS